MSDAREQARHISEVTKAYAEGKEIEFRGKAQTFSWKETNRPLWDWDQNDYRVKPEERKPREFKICVCSDGSVLDYRDDEVRHTDEVILVREVLPETETE